MKKIIGILGLLFVFNAVFAAEVQLPVSTTKSIHDAAREGDLKGIQDNIKFKDEMDLSGQRPIHCAANNLQIEAIRYLLKAGVNVNSTNISGVTALHILSSLGQAGNVQFLLQYSPNVNLKDRILGSPSLHYAVTCNNISTLQILLNPDPYNKVNINLQNNLGQSALHLAVINHNLPIVNMLLSAGIDRTLTDQDYKTALMLALEYRATGYNMNAIINALAPNFLASEAQQIQAQIQAAQLQAQIQIQEAQRQADMQNQIQQWYMQLFQQEQMQNSIPPRNTATVEEIIDEPAAAPIQPQAFLRPPPGFEHRSKTAGCSSQPSSDIGTCRQEAQLPSNIQQAKEEVSKRKQESHDDLVRQLYDVEYPALQTTDKKEAKVTVKTKGVSSGLEKLINDIVSSKTTAAQIAIKAELVDEGKENDSVSDEEEGEDDEDVQDEDEVLETQSATEKVKLEKKKKKKERKKKRIKPKTVQSANGGEISSLTLPNDMAATSETVIQAKIEEDIVDQKLVNEIKDQLPADEAQEPEALQESIEEGVATTKKVTLLHNAIRSKKSLVGLLTFENVNTADDNDNGNLPLHLAAIEQNLKLCQEIIKVILENDQDCLNIINAPNNSGFTALHYAAVKNNPEIADFLLLCGSDRTLLSEKMQNRLVNMANKFQEDQFPSLNKLRTQPYIEPSKEAVATSSSCVSEHKESACFQRPDNLIENPKLHTNKEYKKFFQALINGDMDIIKTSLNKHPEWLYVITPDNLNTLYHAAVNDSYRYSRGTQKEKLVVTKYIISLDPRIMMFKDKKFDLPLIHHIVLLGKIDACIYLVSQLNKIEQLDIESFLTELIEYCNARASHDPNNPNFATINKILTSSLNAIKKPTVQAQVGVQSSEKPRNQYLGCDKEALGKTFNLLASGYFFSKDPNTRKEIIDLIDAGADVSGPINDSGSTYLHKFASINDFELLRKLLHSRKVDPKIKNNRGDLALHCAASYGFVNSVTCLMCYNRELKNEQNNDGNTPLHLAVLDGHLPVVQLLIKLDVDTQIKNQEGLTPFLLALNQQQKECAKVLYDHTIHNINRTDQDILEDYKKAIAINSSSKSEFFHALRALFEPNESTLEPDSSSSSVSLQGMTKEENAFFHAIAIGRHNTVKSMLAANSTLLYSRNSSKQLPMHALMVSKINQKDKDPMFNLFVQTDIKTAIERDENNKTALHLAIDNQLEEAYLCSFFSYLGLYSQKIPFRQIIEELKLYCMDLKKDCDQEKEAYLVLCLNHLNALQILNNLGDK